MLKFPMPLRPFERLFLYADRPENPSTFVFKLDFAGPLSQSTANKALEKVLALQPLSTCQVSWVNGTPCWVPTKNTPQIQWLESHPEDHRWGTIEMEITDGPPVQLIAYDGGRGKASMLVHVHHCAFDGLGALQFVEAFLQSYRAVESGRSYPRSEPNDDLLKLRCRPNLVWATRMRLLPGQWRSVRETVRVMTRKVIPLAIPKCSGQCKRRAGYMTLYFDRQQTESLKKLAASNQSSLNSLMARELLLVIRSWQTEIQRAKEDGAATAAGSHFRLMIPVNERDRSMRTLPACNHCTIINLDFRPDELDEPKSIIRKIEHRMRLIRRWRLSLNFWRVLSLFEWLPGGLKGYATRDRIAATALLTNVGRVFQKFVSSTSGSDEAPSGHELSLTDFHGYAPLARGVFGAFGIYVFKNELRVSLQFDEGLIESSDAQHLLDSLRTKLLSHLH